MVNHLKFTKHVFIEFSLCTNNEKKYKNKTNFIFYTVKMLYMSVYQ